MEAYKKFLLIMKHKDFYLKEMEINLKIVVMSHLKIVSINYYVYAHYTMSYGYVISFKSQAA